jgi:hypothetical protein
MPAPQIPDNNQKMTDDNGYVTTSWFTFLQGIYKACRFNIPLKLGGILNINTTSVSNIGAGIDDLITYTMPANTMRYDGDYLEIEAWGVFAANANNKTVTLNFGGQIIYTTAANIANSGTWSLKGKIIRISPTSQEILVEMLSNNADLQNDTDYPAFRSAGTQDLTTKLIIKCTGAGTADNDIIQKVLVTKLIPNA